MALGDVIAGPFALSYFSQQGLALAADDTLFNADAVSDEVKNISLTGTDITSWAADNLSGLTYDDTDDTLWAVHQPTDLIIHYSLTGTILTSFTISQVSSPLGITTIAESPANLRVYDTVDEELWLISKAGAFIGITVGGVSPVNIKNVAYQQGATDPLFRGDYFISYFSPGRIENIDGQFISTINYTINTSVNQSGIAWDGANLWSVNASSNELELLEIDGLPTEPLIQGYIGILI